MGTRNFTSVILDGKQVVCQYCQWDGYPSYAGVKILEFLRDVNMERFKEALRNTKMSLTDYKDATTYTGSTKKISDISERVWNKQFEINKNRAENDEYINTYQTVMRMFKKGELSASEVDDYIVSTRDTGCDILPFIYERSLDAAQLELFADKIEFAAVQDFATNKDYVGFPGCDAQGYYMINLDNNTIKLAFDDFVCEYNLDELPQNIDKEMLVFEKTTEELYSRDCDGFDLANLITNGEDEKGAGGLWDVAAEIAVEIGLSMRKEHPELLVDAEKDGPVYAEDFGQELIYRVLCEKVKEKHAEKEISATALNELKDFIEEKGWSVSDCQFGGNTPGWEISQYSPAGEDFSFAVQHNNSYKQAVNEIREYALAFDVDEHVQLNLGMRGAPGAAKLVEDACEIEEMLNNLEYDVAIWCPSNKKPALDEVISSCEEATKSGHQTSAPSRDIDER